MELSLTVLQQVIIMFILILVGVLCYKLKFINQDGNKQLTSLLLYIVNPLVVINSYQIPFEKQLAKNLGIAFLLAIASHLISMAIAYIFIREKPFGKNNLDKTAQNNRTIRTPIERFSIIYSNCGFMAFPLIFALFKSEGIFYASAYLAVFTLLSWTHGYITMSGKADKQAFKNAFLSPVLFSVVIGLVLFFFNIKLPAVLATSVSNMASLNTPLAMIVTGVSLAQSSIIKAFKTKRCYYVVLLINVIAPAIAALIYAFLPIDQTIVTVNLIATACPCAVTTLLFSTKFNRDETYASNILTISNICCLLTIPLVIVFYSFVRSVI